MIEDDIRKFINTYANANPKPTLGVFDIALENICAITNTDQMVTMNTIKVIHAGICTASKEQKRQPIVVTQDELDIINDSYDKGSGRDSYSYAILYICVFVFFYILIFFKINLEDFFACKPVYVKVYLSSYSMEISFYNSSNLHLCTYGMMCYFHSINFFH